VRRWRDGTVRFRRDSSGVQWCLSAGIALDIVSLPGETGSGSGHRAKPPRRATRHDHAPHGARTGPTVRQWRYRPPASPLAGGDLTDTHWRPELCLRKRAVALGSRAFPRVLRQSNRTLFSLKAVQYCCAATSYASLCSYLSAQAWPARIGRVPVLRIPCS
jgi:hypothetical protein